MQTIVNLVSAGLGVAWVPGSVRQFQRPGIVYREVASGGRGARAAAKVPGCETSLVWNEAAATPALARFLAFARDHVPGHAHAGESSGHRQRADRAAGHSAPSKSRPQ